MRFCITSFVALALQCWCATYSIQAEFAPTSLQPSQANMQIFAEEDLDNVTLTVDRSPNEPVPYELISFDDIASKRSAFGEALFGRDSILMNTQAFSGVDTYKSTIDNSFVNPPANGLPAVGAGFSNNAGFVNGFNTTSRIGLGRVRAQFGSSLGVYDVRGRDVGSNRTQAEYEGFLTAGIYKRSNIRENDPFCWGVVYDHIWTRQGGFNATGDFDINQVRALVGYALNENNEIGFWSATHGSEKRVSAAVGRLRGINQYNIYLRHNFDFGGSGMIYAGAVDHVSAGSWILGQHFVAPLSNRTGIYANSAYMFPSGGAGSLGAGQMLWSAGFGLVVSFGGGLRGDSISGPETMPLLPVANNSTFKVSTTRIE